MIIRLKRFINKNQKKNAMCILLETIRQRILGRLEWQEEPRWEGLETCNINPATLIKEAKCTVINQKTLSSIMFVIYLAKIPQNPKKPIMIWTKEAIIKAPCMALMERLNLWKIKPRINQPTSVTCTNIILQANQNHPILWYQNNMMTQTSWGSGNTLILVERATEIAGMRKENDAPTTTGSLVPNQVCNNVLIPPTNSSVWIIWAFSTYSFPRNKNSSSNQNNQKQSSRKFQKK